LGLLAEAKAGAEALGLDPDSHAWKEIAALRAAVDAAGATAR
jgi:hypothetical protein